MNGVMIIGHGNFGSGLNSTLELIAGKQDFVKYADFIPAPLQKCRR